MDDSLYEKLNELRNEYRMKMNRSADAAQEAAQKEEMQIVSMCSTDSERYREAFHALNRAFQIIDNAEAATALSGGQGSTAV